MSKFASRNDFLLFALPATEDYDIDEVLEVLRAGWLTSGLWIQKFEHDFAAEMNTTAVLALSSGTAAMPVVRGRFGSGGDYKSMTFCSTTHVIEQVGGRLLFVDIKPATTGDLAGRCNRTIIPVNASSEKRTVT